MKEYTAKALVEARWEKTVLSGPKRERLAAVKDFIAWWEAKATKHRIEHEIQVTQVRHGVFTMDVDVY